MLRKKGRLVSSRHSTNLTPQQLKERYLARAATKLGGVIEKFRFMSELVLPRMYLKSTNAGWTGPRRVLNFVCHNYLFIFLIVFF